MSGEVSKIPLDVVAMPDGIVGPPLPSLVIAEYPSKFEFNTGDIAAGLAGLGVRSDTLLRTQVWLMRGPLPKVEGPSLPVAGLYYAKPWGAHDVQLGIMVEDGKGGEREQTVEELNENLWHEFAHLVARQDELDQRSRLLGPLARARVSRAMGRMSRTVIVAGTAGGAVSGGVDVDAAIKLFEAPIGLEHNPALRLAIVLGAAALNAVGFGILAKKAWKGLTGFVHRTMHNLDPAERFANQHAAIYAKHFKAIRACDNQ